MMSMLDPASRRGSALRAGACLMAFFLVSTAQMSTRRTQWVELSPIAESDGAHAGSTVRLALQVSIADGFHIQANHPKDPSLIPAKLTLDVPEGVTFQDVTFPAPSDFRIPGFDETQVVFEGTILVGVRLAIAPGRAAGPIPIAGHFEYQACDDKQCFRPSTVEANWALEVVPGSRATPPQHPDIFDRIDFGRAEPPEKAAEARAAAPAPRVDSAAPGDVLALFDRFEIAGPSRPYMTKAEFLRFLQDSERGVRQRSPFEGRGVLAILALVFIGGLALNLTPCVLPMIPINLAIIGAGAQASRRSRGFALGAVYGGAMAVVYGVLGLIVILTAGTFGAINASVWFNAGIALLFVFLGLAMFDLFSLDFSRWSSRIRFDTQSRGTFVLAFGMGAVAALLAGACVAPVVIQVVVFATNLYAGGASLALALPFFLGLGMAIPWPIAGAGMASLPKPGAWMVRVKQVMGVFILATAAYYAYVAYRIVDNRHADPAAVEASVQAQLEEGWHASLRDGLLAAQQNGTPVLVDFWASWCKDCLVMDRTTLRDADVKAALAGYTRIKFQAEDPDASPARELLQRVGSIGLPTYVVLKPRTP
jgi:cytochrome c biogenesis protein CcdA/DsbC/DsbD-like thiol-disulfide interchange protein/thiol-disulfide isomerase/thioredoxin